MKKFEPMGVTISNGTAKWGQPFLGKSLTLEIPNGVGDSFVKRIEKLQNVAYCSSVFLVNEILPRVLYGRELRYNWETFLRCPNFYPLIVHRTNMGEYTEPNGWMCQSRLIRSELGGFFMTDLEMDEIKRISAPRYWELEHLGILLEKGGIESLEIVDDESNYGSRISELLIHSSKGCTSVGNPDGLKYELKTWLLVHHLDALELACEDLHSDDYPDWLADAIVHRNKTKGNQA